MPKLVHISFPKDGTDFQFMLPDETIEYLQSKVDDKTYKNLSDALSAFTLEAINYNNIYRKEKQFPVDFPFLENFCPICELSELEDTHEKTLEIGFVEHCPKCFYSFRLCKKCKKGLIYRLDKEVSEHIEVTEYCTQCDFEEPVLLMDNFSYVEFSDIFQN